MRALRRFLTRLPLWRTLALAVTLGALATCTAASAASTRLGPPKNCPWGSYCGLAPGQVVPGCPSGDVCVYNGSTFASGVELRFYTYAAYNLHNQYGRHLVVNNQHVDRHYHEAADADLCTGYNGTRQQYSWVSEGDYQVENLTPVNSIVLKAGAYPLNVPDCDE